MTNHLWHYTISTEHGRESPRSEVGDDIIGIVTPWLAPGEHKLPHPGNYSLVVPNVDEGWFGTVFGPQRRPLASILVASTAFELDSIWPDFEKLYHDLTDMPGFRACDFAMAKKQDRFPLCAALPILMTPSEMWVADFERCLAWAWLESKGLK